MATPIYHYCITSSFIQIFQCIILLFLVPQTELCTNSIILTICGQTSHSICQIRQLFASGGRTWTIFVSYSVITTRTSIFIYLKYLFPFWEMVKTIVLRQDPSLCKRSGALFMYPPPPPFPTCLVCITPNLSGVETKKKILNLLVPFLQECKPHHGTTNMKVST